MPPSQKKQLAADVADTPAADATPVEELPVPRSAAIGDVLSMKGLLDDYVLLLLEEQYGTSTPPFIHVPEQAPAHSPLQASSWTSATPTCACRWVPLQVC